MSDKKNPDVIDAAVEFLREYYRARGEDIRPAHAHAAVSHYLGYNSKIALKSDSFFDSTTLTCSTTTKRVSRSLSNASPA